MFSLKDFISGKEKVFSTHCWQAPSEENEEELWDPSTVVLKPHPLLILTDCVSSQFFCKMEVTMPTSQAQRRSNEI